MNKIRRELDRKTVEELYDREELQKTFVLARVIFKAGATGKSKKDWGCASGKCNASDSCDPGINPFFAHFNALPDYAYTPPPGRAPAGRPNPIPLTSLLTIGILASVLFVSALLLNYAKCS